MDSGVQEALADESLEGITAKWMKKEPGITGKSVTVLRRRDVIVRSGIAFMPNTIEMAQLKKPEKGQFKTNVQFCSKMTEADVKKLLIDTFPYLENQRFYCAAAADNRTRLDFHGQPRIWDGQFIKRKIKGNSALYILTDEESDDGLDSKVPEQMTLKRSHDQITSPENEMSEQSLKTGTKSANTSNILTGFKAAVHGSSILTGASAEGSQPKLPEKMPQMVPCIYVPVTGQHDSAVQSGAIPKARISTASNQQSLSKTADGSSNTWQARLPLAIHKMPQEMHSVLTPDMNKLHIFSSQSPGQLQKTVNVEKTVLTRDQRAWTTEGRGSSEVGVPVTTTAQGDKSFELVKGAGTGFQQGARMVLSDLPSHATDDQPDSGFSDAEEKGASWNSAAEAAVLSDSGLENTGAPSTNPNTCIQDQNYSSKDLILDWIEAPLGTFPDEDFPLYLNTDLQEIPQIATDPRPCQIPAGPVITGAENGISSKGVVQNPRIYPKSSDMEGGEEFLIAFPEPLALEVTSGGALFKGVGFAPLRKYSQCDLAGIVPRSTKPGIVDVKVFDQSGNCLGTTTFCYRSPTPWMEVAVRNENLPMLFSVLEQKFKHLQVSAGDNAAQGLGPLNIQDQGQTQQQQSLQLLQLLVYTAAETGAQEFIEIIYSTSAGRTIFYSYKDKTPLPEDVARANGHTYLAQYLQDVNTRLSKEVGSEAQSNPIDWLELVKAVQTQASAAQGKSVKEEKHPSESDDNSSDYFADSETSSHGSSDLDDSIKSDSDSDSFIEDEKLFGPTQFLSSVDCNDIIGLKKEQGSLVTCGSGKCFTVHDGCGKWSLVNPLLKDQQVIDGNSSEEDDQETSNGSSEAFSVLSETKNYDTKISVWIVTDLFGSTRDFGASLYGLFAKLFNQDKDKDSETGLPKKAHKKQVIQHDAWASDLVDAVVQGRTVRPKLGEPLFNSIYVRSCKKDDNVRSDSFLSDILQAWEERKTFSVFVSGHGNREDLQPKGYDSLAEGIAESKESFKGLLSRYTKRVLPTINRELAIHLAKVCNVKGSIFPPECSEADKRVTASHRVQLFEAEKLHGLELDLWLSSLPHRHALDSVIGHGAGPGKQVELIQRHHHCKWVQVVHSDPKELGIFKWNADAISKGEKQHQLEVKLFELSDQVAAVGYLRPFCNPRENVFILPPGIFSEFSSVKQASEDRRALSVLVLGNGNSEDLQLNEYDIAGKAVAELLEFRRYIDVPIGQEEKVTEMFLLVRSFKEREQLAAQLCEVDLVIIPSRSEGFGLVVLEALSAGLPVLVNSNFGLREALSSICNKRRELRLKKLMHEEHTKTYILEEQCKSFKQRIRYLVSGFCTKDAASKEEPNKRPATSMKEPTNEIPDMKEKLSRLWHSYSLSGWLSKWGDEQCGKLCPPSPLAKTQYTSTTGLHHSSRYNLKSVPRDFQDHLLGRKLTAIQLKFYCAICIRLGKVQECFWDDYRFLCEKISLTKKEVAWLGQNSNPTDSMMQKFDSKKDSNIGKFRSILEEMERHDVVNVINEWIVSEWVATCSSSLAVLV